MQRLLEEPDTISEMLLLAIVKGKEAKENREELFQAGFRSDPLTRYPLFARSE